MHKENAVAEAVWLRRPSGYGCRLVTEAAWLRSLHSPETIGATSSGSMHKSDGEWAADIMADIQEAGAIDSLSGKHSDSGFGIRDSEVADVEVATAAFADGVGVDERVVVGCIEDEEQAMEQLIAAAIDVVKVRVAMDSAATDNVIPPGDLPSDVVLIPNTSGKHFVGANNAHIEKYGQVDTVLKSPAGNRVSCAWQASDVNRALHSVAKVCGPKGEGNAKQDVLFDNDVCVVAPPGVVKAILKRLKPVMQYEREGNLYVAELGMSSFPRQGQHA